MIQEIYQKSLQAFGPQNWWPAETQLEIVVGTVLTQNTSWTNVEKSIVKLKEENLLWTQNLKDIPLRPSYSSPNKGDQREKNYLQKWQKIPESDLAEIIRSSGYFRQKSQRLKGFLSWVIKDYSQLSNLFKQDLQTLRKILLQQKGIGPETADSIILYAAQKTSFVVDAYTQRILFRHQLIPENSSYEQTQTKITQSIPLDLQMYNEYHALIVHLGKNFCKKKNPLCQSCPLNGLNWDSRTVSP